MTSTTGNPLTRRERLIYRMATSLDLGVMVFSIVNFVFNDSARRALTLPRQLVGSHLV